jgi:hypothetical protein
LPVLSSNSRKSFLAIGLVRAAAMSDSPMDGSDEQDSIMQTPPEEEEQEAEKASSNNNNDDEESEIKQPATGPAALENKQSRQENKQAGTQENKTPARSRKRKNSLSAEEGEAVKRAKLDSNQASKLWKTIHNKVINYCQKTGANVKVMKRPANKAAAKTRNYGKGGWFKTFDQRTATIKLELEAAHELTDRGSAAAGTWLAASCLSFDCVEQVERNRLLTDLIGLN